ncbi:hypothetical protein ACNKHX_10115 [Shigella flexneri]
MRNVGWSFSPETLAALQIHLLSGVTMPRRIFILTYPVTRFYDQSWSSYFRRAGGLISLVDLQFGGYPTAWLLPSCWRHHVSSDSLLHASCVMAIAR